MTNQHTPLPWESDGDSVVSVDWGTIATTAQPFTTNGKEVARANAGLIVTAVNHHAELLEALEIAFDALRAPAGAAVKRHDAEMQARAVLAKVRGE